MWFAARRRLAVLLLVAVTVGAAATPLAAQPAAADQQSRSSRIYLLEDLQIEGTKRMTSAQMAETLAFTRGTPLTDELVTKTRQRLLGLGLFRSVIPMMRKGSKPGWARLVVLVEDDPSVLTDWAVGGELGARISEEYAPVVEADQTPLDYRISLVSRNMFSAMHRGSILVDIDQTGMVREAQLAYGLPRFAREDVQFDAEIAAVDVTRRYLNALGFAGRGQGLWSRTLTGFGEFQYGAAMYVNKAPRFSLPSFPRSVAGPKIAYFKETRLRGFVPREGHKIAASLLFAPMKTEDSVAELNLAQTFDLWSWAYLTFDVSGLAVAAAPGGYSVRGESRVDVPFGPQMAGQDSAAAFLRLRGGSDKYEKTRMRGSSAILGIRYFSSGFIAELSLKITRSPDQFREEPVFDPDGEGGR